METFNLLYLVYRLENKNKVIAFVREKIPSGYFMTINDTEAKFCWQEDDSSNGNNFITFSDKLMPLCDFVFKQYNLSKEDTFVWGKDANKFLRK